MGSCPCSQCYCHSGIAWGLGHERTKERKEREIPLLSLNVRDSLCRPELEGFSVAPSVHMMLIVGYEAVLSLD